MGPIAPHKTTTTDGSLYLMVDTRGVEVRVGRTGYPAGETAQETEQRWNDFTRHLFHGFGLEPVTDEPTFTTLDGGQFTEHYVLQNVAVNL